MMSENQQANISEAKTIPFGARLQSAREALGLESKDAAAQLRLNERIIQLMEKDCYATGLHPTFIRGYLRAYGKLLQIPEHEIKLAIEPIKPSTSIPSPIEAGEEPRILTTSNYFMQISTSLIVFTLVSLVGIWWYMHSPKQASNEQPANIVSQTSTAINLPIAASATANAIPPRIEAPTPTNTPTSAGVQAQAQAPTSTTAQPTTPSASPVLASTATPANKAKNASLPQNANDDTDEYEDD